MDNKDLANIIENHARIILPDFGAFLLKDSNSNTFKPELITFSPFLKYNDGVLEEYYCKYKGVSKDESIKQIKAFIENLKETLKTEGYYIINGIGTLTRDSRGAVVLNTENKIPTKADDNNIITKPTDEKPKKTAKSKKAAIIDSKATLINEETIQKTKPEENEEIIEIDPVNINDIEIISDFSEVTPTPSENNSIIEIDDTPTEPINVSEKVTINQIRTTPDPMAKSKKKSKLALLLIYLGISLTVILVFAFIIREMAFNTEDTPFKIETPKKSNNIESQSNTKESNNDLPKDSIDKAFDEINTEEIKANNETSNVEVQIEKSVIENASIQNQVNEQYHLIVGSFKDKTNADRYSNQLKSEGYNSTVIIQPNGNNSVTVGSFLSKEKAISEKNRLTSKFPNIWISNK